MKPVVILSSIIFLVLVGFGSYKLIASISKQTPTTVTLSKVLGTNQITTTDPTPATRPLPSPTSIPQSTPTLTIQITPTTSSSSIKPQLLQATYGPPNGFIPTEFKVKAGQPVRLEVQAMEDGVGCMGSIMVPEFTGAQYFEKGKTNVLEFILPSPGEYPITCAMGIPHGFILAE